MHYNEKKDLTTAAGKLLTVLPSLFWVLLLFCFDDVYIAVITLISAVIHELGHEFYLYRLTGKFVLPRGALHGLKIKEIKQLSYKEETILYICGPFANIAIGLSVLLLNSFDNSYIYIFAVVNIITGLSNMLPIEGYDGYGALNCMLSEHLQLYTAHRIMTVLSFTFTLVLCLLSLYIINRFGESFWIFAVFLVSLLAKISNFLKNRQIEE